MDDFELVALVLLKDRSVAGAFVRVGGEDQAWVIEGKISAMAFDPPYRLIIPGDDAELVKWMDEAAAKKGRALPRLVVFDSVREAMGV